MISQAEAHFFIVMVDHLSLILTCLATKVREPCTEGQRHLLLTYGQGIAYHKALLCVITLFLMLTFRVCVRNHCPT